MSLSKEKLVESKFGRFRAFDGLSCFGKGVAAFAILLGLPWESAITDLSEDGQFFYYFDNSSGWCQIVLKPLKYGVFIYNPATGDFVGPLFIVRNSVVASTKQIRLHFNGKLWENQVVLRTMRNTKSLLCETRPNENRHYDPRHDVRRLLIMIFVDNYLRPSGNEPRAHPTRRNLSSQVRHRPPKPSDYNYR